MTVRQVGVVGCGIMGGGIAQVCASHGYEVRVLEVDQQRLDQGLAAIKGRLTRDIERGRLAQEDYEGILSRLTGTTDIGRLSDCDLVVEVVVEELATKERLFTELGRICRPEAILASNTSTFSISALAAASGRPEKVIGLHFFNPCTVLRLVEVITPESASQATIDEALAFCNSIDRLTVCVKDTPGFIVNRLGVPFFLEAIRLAESGTATPEAIDKACREGLNHAMGPLATADLIGLDTLLHMSESLFQEYGEPRFKAPPLLRQKVSLGFLGRKSGKGFFNYAAKEV